MIYLFIGQDSLSKDIQLKRLKQEFFKKDTEQFNFDTLYARELNLITLQERLLFLPLKAKKRIIVIKGAQELKEDIREFILKYAKSPRPEIILVLDIDRKEPREKIPFIVQITKFARILHFRESAHLDTFSLSRQIDLHNADYALRVLNQLLKNGEKPERILGGLRYAWERGIGIGRGIGSGRDRDGVNRLETRKRIKFILNCDIDIKTGRLKPVFALERLVVKLCGLSSGVRTGPRPA